MSTLVHPLAELDPILQEGGERGALMRAVDWSSNPLGKPSGWPKELPVIVGVMLGSKQPMFIVWGPTQTTLYNDAYSKICGNRHPVAMGQPFHEIWFEIWEQLDPIVSDAYNGISTSMDDIELIMHRNGFPEETALRFLLLANSRQFWQGAGDVLPLCRNDGPGDNAPPARKGAGPHAARFRERARGGGDPEWTQSHHFLPIANTRRWWETAQSSA